jgi:hypothetical protein
MGRERRKESGDGFAKNNLSLIHKLTHPKSMFSFTIYFILHPN